MFGKTQASSILAPTYIPILRPDRKITGSISISPDLHLLMIYEIWKWRKECIQIIFVLLTPVLPVANTWESHPPSRSLYHSVEWLRDSTITPWNDGEMVLSLRRKTERGWMETEKKWKCFTSAEHSSQYTMVEKRRNEAHKRETCTSYMCTCVNADMSQRWCAWQRSAHFKFVEDNVTHRQKSTTERTLSFFLHTITLKPTEKWSTQETYILYVCTFVNVDMSQRLCAWHKSAHFNFVEDNVAHSRKHNGADSYMPMKWKICHQQTTCILLQSDKDVCLGPKQQIRTEGGSSQQTAKFHQSTTQQQQTTLFNLVK